MKPQLFYDIEANQYVVRVYDGEHPDNYVAHALVRTYGDVGLMSSIVGDRFYECVRDHVADLMTLAHIRTLEGYMTDAHARLLRIALRRTCTVDTPRRGMCSGREMPWVVVTLREAA